MATVPSYGGLHVGAAVAPDAQFEAPRGPTPGDINAQQGQALARAAEGAGATATGIATDQLDIANQVKVNDALNQVRGTAQRLAYDPKEGYLNLKGDAALTRPDGQSIDQEYGGKLRETISSISSGLSNDAQRRAFMLQADGLHTSFQGEVERHKLGEFRSFAMSTQDGMLATSADAAKRNWQNPDAINTSLASVKAAVYQKGQISGWAPAEIDAATLTATSKVHTDVILAGLENNQPTYSLAYLDRYKSGMTADDILRVQGHVNTAVWQGAAMQAVGGATSNMQSTAAPTDANRLFGITAKAESGGSQTNPDGTTRIGYLRDKDGKLKLDAAGNKIEGGIGYMQVTKGTGPEAAKLAGLPWDEGRLRNDEAYNRKLGEAYLQAQLQTYGDPAKAWGAYNAGPGAVDRALKASAKDGSDWLSHMPPETQKYVAANVAKLGDRTAGLPTRPNEETFVNDALGRLPAGAPPQLVKMTRDQAVTQFGIINKGWDEKGKNAQLGAQQWLAANPGGDLAQMPPDLRDGVNRWAPGSLVELEKLSKALKRGDTVTNLGTYNDIVTHMPNYAAMSDTAWNYMQTQLSPGNFESLSRERAQFQSGKHDNGAGNLDTSALNLGLNERLESLNINVRPGAGDAAGRERLGGIQQYVRDEIVKRQAQVGHKFNAAELEGALDGIFAKDARFTDSFLGMSVPLTGKTMPLMAVTYEDIPSSTKDAIKARLVAEGVGAPTNNQIVNRYRAVRSAKPFTETAAPPPPPAPAPVAPPALPSTTTAGHQPTLSDLILMNRYGTVGR